MAKPTEATRSASSVETARSGLAGTAPATSP
jgi:hypothetical protein